MRISHSLLGNCLIQNWVSEDGTENQSVDLNSSPPLPNITHTQFLILDVLKKNGELSGPDLRFHLETAGCKKSHVSFSQIMSRLQASGYTTSHSLCILGDVGGIPLKCYEITEIGTNALDQTKAFYRNRLGDLVAEERGY